VWLYTPTLAGALAFAASLGAMPARAATSCSDLVHLSLPETTITAATLVTSGTITPPAPEPPVTGLPALCRVSLRIAPQINVEVWLPVTWNQRFQAVGGSGYAGVISWSALGTAARAGYATTSTDTGHSALTPLDGSFALHADGSLNTGLITDFASRSLHEMTQKAQALTSAFYGHAPVYAYWNGCSTGGRQGLLQAQRFPADYDGILAAAPAINMDRFQPSTLWPQIVMQADSGGLIAASKRTAVTSAAVAACDALDGVMDGIIDDPRQCHYDPAALLCQAGDNPATCLTAAEARAVRKIWEGPTTTEGRRLWFGLERGTSLLGGWFTGSVLQIPIDYFRYWLYEDPTFDWHTVTEASFPADFRLSERKFHDVIGTDDDNLQQFRKQGGKVLIWHGQADQLIPPRGTIQYYERLFTGNGGAKHVQDFARLFLAPGVAHCGGGPGPNTFDAFAVLVDWVEFGTAPERITAALLQGSTVVRTRPLCAYPQVAQWTGHGSTDDAANFACVDTYHDDSDLKVSGPR
jgi:hypothetical protein